MATRDLFDLPPDVLLRVMSLAGGRAIPQMACTCRKLEPLGRDESLWADAFEESFRPVLRRWLSGKRPASVARLGSWRERYARMEQSWVSAVVLSGVLLLRLDGHIYDVSEFFDRHPGGPILDYDSLCDERAFDVGYAFGLVGHSAAAKKQLDDMLVLPPRGRSRWPAPPSCDCPDTTFAVVSVADNLRSAGARLLALILWLWRGLLGFVLAWEGAVAKRAARAA